MRRKHTQITFTRIYAGFAILLCILTVLAIAPHICTGSDFLDCILAVLSVVLAILYIFFPQQYCLLAVPHFLFFLKDIVTGGTQTAAFMYLAAVILLFANGFFRTKAKLKCGIFAAVLFAGILSQFRFSTVTPFLTLTFFLFLIFFFLIIISLVYRNVKNLMPENIDIFIPELKTVLDLNEYDFSERDLFIIKALQQHKTYAEISKSLVCSESVVKKTALEIFAQFNMKNQMQFLSYINQFAIKYPPAKRAR